MTSDTSIITDPSRPRPVRLAAFLGTLLLALLGIATVVWSLAPALVGAVTVAIGVAQLGGWLFVEAAVTPVRDPAIDEGGGLVRLVPADTPNFGVTVQHPSRTSDLYPLRPDHDRDGGSPHVL